MNRPLIVRARVKSGSSWSDVAAAPFTIEPDYSKLTFTEVMFHATDSNSQREHEFVELKNTGTNVLDLRGLMFIESRDPLTTPLYTFTNTYLLPPGQFCVIGGALVPGAIFASADLSNESAELSLVTGVGAVVAKMAYDTHAPWQVVPDNHGYFPRENPVGFSLVRKDHNGAEPTDHSSWRASARRGGSPGSDDPEPTVLPIYINEVLTRSGTGLPDTVELFNPNAVDVDLGGWWLSDERNWPFHYKIPGGTAIRAMDYLLITEDQFSAGTNGFSLSAEGDRCYLFSGDKNGELTGFSHGVTLGASERDVSFGREILKDGSERFAPQRALSFGSPNAGARLSNVVISEVNYHPQGGDAEFIELRNLAPNPVPLFDGGGVIAPWAIGPDDPSLAMVFPPNITIPANGMLVLAEGDTSLFRARHAVPGDVQVIPLAFKLSNGGEKIQLFKASGQSGGTTRYVAVDQVEYDDKLPWPSSTDGGGFSLERGNLNSFGDDPASWRSNPKGISPGRNTNTNHPPQVWAGEDRAAFLNQFVTLKGSIDDDRWMGTELTASWSVPGGQIVSRSGTEVTVNFSAAGLYVAELTVNDGGFIVRDSIRIAVQTRPFDEWRQAHFTGAEMQNFQVSGATSDPDVDGIVNLQEYFFDTRPKVVDLAAPFSVSTDGKKLAVTWQQLADVPDVLFTPEMAHRAEGPWFSASELFAVTERLLDERRLKEVTLVLNGGSSTPNTLFVRLALVPL